MIFIGPWRSSSSLSSSSSLLSLSIYHHYCVYLRPNANRQFRDLDLWGVGILLDHGNLSIDHVWTRRERNIFGKWYWTAPAHTHTHKYTHLPTSVSKDPLKFLKSGDTSAHTHTHRYKPAAKCFKGSLEILEIWRHKGAHTQTHTCRQVFRRIPWNSWTKASSVPVPGRRSSAAD